MMNLRCEGQLKGSLGSELDVQVLYSRLMVIIIREYCLLTPCSRRNCSSRSLPLGPTANFNDASTSTIVSLATCTDVIGVCSCMSVDVACEILSAPVVSNAFFTVLVIVKNKLLSHYYRHVVVVVLKDRLDPWIGSQVRRPTT